MQHSSQHKSSLINYHTEPPDMLEDEIHSLHGEQYESPSQVLCDFVEDNIWYIVSILGLLLLMYSARPQIPDARYRGRFRRQMRQLKEALAEKPAEREERIGEALTMKVVTGHDEEGNLTLGEQEDVDEEADAASSTRNNELEDDEEEPGECVICLEPFELGDEVAWSGRQDDCKHVWHSECIRSWLRESNHEECPSCRTILLPELEGNETATPESAEEGQVNGDYTQVPSTASEDSEDAVFVILKGQDCVAMVR